jgi:hypothetical protein
MLSVNPFLTTTQTGIVTAVFKLGQDVFHDSDPLM